MSTLSGIVVSKLICTVEFMYYRVYSRVDVMLLCLRFDRQMLDKVLDFENDRVSKHLGQIAESMYEWEGSVAEQLGLTPADIAAIKAEHPGKLKLQT